MALKDSFGKITVGGVALTLILVIVSLQMIFWLLGMAMPSLANIKFGTALYFLAAGTVAYIIFKFATKKESLERRDVLYLLLVIGMIAGFYFVTKNYLPQMFSIAIPPQFQVP